MKRLINSRFGTRAIITGLILCGIGYAISMIDIFSVYGKASATSSCWHALDSCNLASNLTAAHIGGIMIYAGFVATGVGVIILIIASRRDT